MRPDEAFDRVEAGALIQRALNEILTERERTVIEGRFYDGLTLEALRPTCNGVCRERVREIQSKALRKLRASRYRRHFSDALEAFGGHSLPDWAKQAREREREEKRQARYRASLEARDVWNREQTRARYARYAASVSKEQAQRNLMDIERHQLGDDPSYEEFKKFIDKWSEKEGVERETCAFLNASDIQLERRRLQLVEARLLEMAAQFTPAYRDEMRAQWMGLPPFHQSRAA